MDECNGTEIELGTPAQYLKGVGPARAEVLKRLGLHCAGDLLFFLPRDYEYPAPRRRMADVHEDEPCSVIGTVTEIDQRTTQTGKHILGVLVEDESSAIRLLFFNQPFRLEQFAPGLRVLVSGKPRLSGLRMEMSHPQVIPLEEGDDCKDGEVLPVYPLTEGINQDR